jgi:hypothetical protein
MESVDKIFAAFVAVAGLTLVLLVGGIYYSASKGADCRVVAMQAHYQATDIMAICK